MNVTIDETLESVERLYMSITGRRPPTTSTPVAALPPEVDPIVHVEQQLARMMSAVESLAPGMTRAPEWVPRAVAWTQDGELVLALDVPGVAREDVRVRVQPLALTVTGKRRVPWSQTPRSVVACDVPLGTFSRSFPLAAGVGTEQVSARLVDGLLIVRVHAGARTEPSQISITQ